MSAGFCNITPEPAHKPGEAPILMNSAKALRHCIATLGAFATVAVLSCALPTPPASAAAHPAAHPAALPAAHPAPAAAAAVAPATAEPPAWQKLVAAHPQAEVVHVFSQAMHRPIPVALLKAAPGAPTLYVLNGADGGQGQANWIDQTDILDFYANKGLNVVIVMAGQHSYYADWEQPSEVLGGPQKWETFLTAELPGVIEKQAQAGPKRAILGMSMSATSALVLAEQHPGLYQAVASFSGCAATTSPEGIAAVMLTTGAGKADAVQMWGQPGSAQWWRHDAVHNAEKLRGIPLYISSGSGLAGENDLLGGPYLRNFPLAKALGFAINTTTAGGAIEAVTNKCTHDLAAKLGRLDIPAEFNFRAAGTHSWGYWQDDLRKSWPIIAGGLGLQ
ncbi:alpha/beta hydrolase [Corynebacterium caspium]|uniref:alpha/beta hydrolase n=1 Tax=Corynebacterium caspium TaxID=234828 RepID=UPI00037EC31C|nr:alpha/beta hydrolase family protein [Corynebacterium caspium]